MSEFRCICSRCILGFYNRYEFNGKGDTSVRNRPTWVTLMRILSDKTFLAIFVTTDVIARDD